MNTQANGAAPILEVRNLHKAFGNLLATRNISFTIQPGELKAVIGPNGAGKTTLFNLITGALAPTRGEIYFQQDKISGLTPFAIARKGLARSFQLLNLFPNLTVFENVRLAVQVNHERKHSLLAKAQTLSGIGEKTEQLLERVGLSAYANQQAAKISYGDQRALEIGLALATDPKLLLLDEPTSGMSPLESQHIAELIKTISKDLTILLIEHHIDMVMALADSILVMHYGEKLAEGSAKQVADDERVQDAYLGGL